MTYSYNGNENPEKIKEEFDTYFSFKVAQLNGHWNETGQHDISVKYTDVIKCPEGRYNNDQDYYNSLNIQNHYCSRDINFTLQADLYAKDHGYFAVALFPCN